MPRLTGTRSPLKCVTVYRLVVFVDDEVVLPQAGDEPPLASDTVAVTLISSTPLLKRKPGSSPRASPAAAAAAAAAAADDQRRRASAASSTTARVMATHDLHSFACTLASIDVRHDRSSVRKLTRYRPTRRARDGDDEGRFAARPQRRRLNDGAAAASEIRRRG